MALVTLMMARGEAVERIAWAKRENIPADTGRAQALVNKLERCITERDFVAATDITDSLNREIFKLQAAEVAAIVRAGRKQRAARAASRDAHNEKRHRERARVWEVWNEVASEHWKPTITKNAVARIVRSKLGLDEKEIPTIARRLKKP